MKEDLSYKDFLGNFHSHEEALLSRVKGSLVRICAEERKVSEKSFTLYGEIIEEMGNHVNIFKNKIFDLYSSNKRINFIAEMIWDDIKNSSVNESILKFKNF